MKERISILEGLVTGDMVSVTFDLRGSEYKGRYYVDLVAWKLEKDNPALQDGSKKHTKDESPDIEWWKDDGDDLPFG